MAERESLEKQLRAMSSSQSLRIPLDDLIDEAHTEADKAVIKALGRIAKGQDISHQNQILIARGVDELHSSTADLVSRMDDMQPKVDSNTSKIKLIGDGLGKLQDEKVANARKEGVRYGKSITEIKLSTAAWSIISAVTIGLLTGAWEIAKFLFEWYWDKKH
jgi:hypothetical protein